MDDARPARALRLPGIVLGAGLGGFVDGIVLHQILQWHHLLTGTEEYPATTLEDLEVNTLWDGLFHLATLLLVAAGLALLWKVRNDGRSVGSGRVLIGWALVGWGLFNLIEGIVDHHILGIHHVRSGPNELLYDVAFLALGAILVLAGYRLATSERTNLQSRV
ncbi:MAG: DUF2243 domain-containing protein [Actinomycetota bacterium]|nr:DUF2243 domain-containing protein [Actinomycetota bacterium]